MADSFALFNNLPSDKPAGKVVDKSPDAYRTIGEAATELDLPTHVLRFWETKFRQINPIKRGGGRRYYRPSDMDVLRLIKTKLHEEGYTIKGVQALLKTTKKADISAVVQTPEVGAAPNKKFLKDLLKDLKAIRAQLADD